MHEALAHLASWVREPAISLSELEHIFCAMQHSGAQANRSVLKTYLNTWAMSRRMQDNSVYPEYSATKPETTWLTI